MTAPHFRIECGNALTLMEGLGSGSVDCVITDPPYSGFEFTGGADHYRNALLPYLNEIKRCVSGRRIAISQPAAYVEALRDDLPVSVLANVPDAFTDHRGAPAIFMLSQPVNTEASSAESWLDIPPATHPNQRDVNKMAAIVKVMSRKGDTILDPFCGSAAIGIACLLLGRNYLGFELDEHRAAEAESRLKVIWNRIES